MRLLLDTHAFLWFLAGDRRLSRRARSQMEATGAELLVSLASVWEMAIKVSLRRLTLPLPFARFMEEKWALGMRLLPIEWEHAVALADLPWHHRDPFDRMIVAQGLRERLPIVSGDPIFAAYGVTLVW